MKRTKTTPKGAGSGPTDPKTPEQRAQVWVLQEEGCSQREIARQTGFALSTVQKVLAEDPARLESLRSAKREERAKLWEQIEKQAITATRDFIRAGHEALINPATGVRRKRISKTGKEVLALACRWASVFRLAADSATTKAQLLTGGATARLEGLGRTDANDMTDEQLIAAAKELGMVEALPHDLRERLVKAEADAVKEQDA